LQAGGVIAKLQADVLGGFAQHLPIAGVAQMYSAASPSICQSPGLRSIRRR
jgi:hypothetical protein